MDRTKLMKLIDKKMMEIYELIDQYIEEAENGVEESGESIEIEPDDDGDYLDKEGNIYNDETGECIGKINPETNQKVFFDDL